MKYKGYIAQIEYSEDDEEWVGSVINPQRMKSISAERMWKN